MAITRKEEARALNADEKELVEKSHHPELQDITDEELPKLAKQLRERRNKARDLAHQRRREIRGKSTPRGATASRADDGSRIKLAVLANAMRRINGEIERRRSMSASNELIANAQKALELKKAGDKNEKSFNTRHARHGMRNIPNEKVDSLIRPAERGRLKKAASVAQAKRDTRQEQAGA